jgi:hypothetical protein
MSAIDFSAKWNQHADGILFPFAVTAS